MNESPPYGKDRGWMWEIDTHSGLKLANLITQQFAKDTVLYNQEVKLTTRDSQRYTCAHCGSSLYLNRNKTCGAHFSHYSPKVDDLGYEKVKKCPFYTGDTKSTFLSEINKGEGAWHFVTKHQVASILSSDPFVDSSSVLIETYIIDHDTSEKRRPDISFFDSNGQQWAIELANHWMNPSIAAKREKFFIKNNIKVIWLMSPTLEATHPNVFEFVLYGLAGTLDGPTRNNCHFNAFSFSDSELEKSRLQQKLIINALIPNFSYKEQTNSIESYIGNKQTSLDSLSFVDRNIIPYLVNKGPNYQEALNMQQTTVTSMKVKLQWEDFAQQQRIKLANDTDKFISCMLAHLEDYERDLDDNHISIKKLESVKVRSRRELESLISRAPYKEKLIILKDEFLSNLEDRIRIQRELTQPIISTEFHDLAGRIDLCTLDAIEITEKEVNTMIHKCRSNDAVNQSIQIRELWSARKDHLMCETFPNFNLLHDLSAPYDYQVDYVEILREWYRLYQKKSELSPNEYLLMFITNQLHENLDIFIKNFADVVSFREGKALSPEQERVRVALEHCKTLGPL